MNATEYLDVLLRRWKLIALLTGAALLLGWFSASSTDSPARDATTYTATHVLAEDPSVSTPGANVEPSLLALLARTGDIPGLVADRLDLPLVDVTSRTSIQVDKDTETLRITATGSGAEAVESLADTFADEILQYAADQREGRRQGSIDRARRVATEQRARIVELSATLAGLPEESVDAQLLQTERDALLASLGSQLELLESLASQSTSEPGYVSLQRAVATPQAGSTPTFSVPTTPVARMATAGLLGLILSAGLALLLEQLDTRLHTRAEAERAFGLPVIVEVPHRTRWQQRRRPVVVDTTRTPAVLAYRRLAASVGRLPRWVLRPPTPSVVVDGTSTPSARDRAGADRLPGGPWRVILVTSPAPREGKSTLSANLAIALAGEDRHVVAVDADGDGRGLSHLLGDRLAEGGPRPQVAHRRPAEPSDWVRLEVAPHGVDTARLTAWVRNVATSADDSSVVIIDTGPVPASPDAVALLDVADVVVVVARAGRTTLEAARRFREQLAQFGAPVAGIALLDVRGHGQAGLSHSVSIAARAPASIRRVGRREDPESSSEAITVASSETPGASDHG